MGNNKQIEPHAIHVLLEVFCSYYWQCDEAKDTVPFFCERGTNHPGYHCLLNGCKYVSFTHAENELAFAGENGEVPNCNALIAIPDLSDKCEVAAIIEHKKKWHEICLKKVSEATSELEELLGTTQQVAPLSE